MKQYSCWGCTRGIGFILWDREGASSCLGDLGEECGGGGGRAGEVGKEEKGKRRARFTVCGGVICGDGLLGERHWPRCVEDVHCV